MEEIQNNITYVKENKNIKKDFSRIGLSLTVYLFIVTAFQFLISFGFKSFYPVFTENGWYPWIVAYLPQVIIGAPICLLMLRTKEPEKTAWGKLGAGHYVLFIIMSVSVMYIGNIIGTLITSIFGAGNVLQNIVTNSNIWATLLFAVILAPIVEELIFRKMIIGRLRKYGDKIAILVSALLFALMHGNLSQFFYAFGLGILFGYVYARTGKLRYSIGLHMIINFLGSFVGSLIMRLINGLDMDMLSKLSSMDEAMSENAANTLGRLMIVGLYGIVIFGLVIAGLVLLIVRRKKAVLSEGMVVIPKGQRGKVILGNIGIICYVIACIAVIVISIL